LAGLPSSPTLTCAWQSFSGADPDTWELERFDPLYRRGPPSAWATASRSSMVFIDYNAQSHGLARRLRLLARRGDPQRYGRPCRKLDRRFHP
jgi:hypothetical protein